MNIYKLATFSCTLFLLGCSPASDDIIENDLHCYSSPKVGGTTCNVPLISLIASPKKYDGMKISVKGYASTTRSDNAGISLLFLSKDDELHSITENAIFVSSFSDEFMSDRFKSSPPGFVRVYGKFRAEKTSLGAAGATLGSIEEIFLLASDVDSPWNGD